MYLDHLAVRVQESRLYRVSGPAEEFNNCQERLNVRHLQTCQLAKGGAPVLDQLIFKIDAGFSQILPNFFKFMQFSTRSENSHFG